MDTSDSKLKIKFVGTGLGTTYAEIINEALLGDLQA